MCTPPKNERGLILPFPPLLLPSSRAGEGLREAGTFDFSRSRTLLPRLRHRQVTLAPPLAICTHTSPFFLLFPESYPTRTFLSFRQGPNKTSQKEPTTYPSARGLCGETRGVKQPFPPLSLPPNLCNPTKLEPLDFSPFFQKASDIETPGIDLNSLYPTPPTLPRPSPVVV